MNSLRSHTWSYNYNDWFVYNSSGDIRYPIYGKPVTNVRFIASKSVGNQTYSTYSEFTDFRDQCFTDRDSSCRLTELKVDPDSLIPITVTYENLSYDNSSKELSNVTLISLSEFDTRIYWVKEERADSFRVASLFGDNHAAVGSIADIAKIYSNIELYTACYSYQNLDNVSCYTGGGVSQLLGGGTPSEGESYNDYVMTDDSIELTNVKDLSMNRHSVCAISLVTDDPYGSTKVYCWGSAFFGQMGDMSGITDTDRAVSYDDVLSANSFFQNRTKYYATPVNLWGN